MIYLDYSATTPVLPEVLDSYNKVTTEYFGNPNSLHNLGSKSNELLESAIKQVSELLKIEKTEFSFNITLPEGFKNLDQISSATVYFDKDNILLV